MPHEWRPRRVDGTERLTSLNAGLVQACGTNVTGETSCWGFFRLYQFRVTEEWLLLSGPIPFVPPPALASVSTGDEHSCGIGAGGSVHCWGKNEFGQLGDGTTNRTRIVDEQRNLLAPRRPWLRISRA